MRRWGTFDDPDGLLLGEGKTGQHLRLEEGAKLPVAAIRRWLASALRHARQPPRG